MADNKASSASPEIYILKIALIAVVVGILYLAFRAEILFPILSTFILGWFGWKIWVHYVQQDFISGIEWVLLEIIPPREVLRSPRAMELFITNALYHYSFKGGKEEYWQGAVWFWHSLEIASIDGQVHFYIRTPSRLKTLVETQMYAQYPQSRVVVADDYTLAVDEISPRSEWNGWGGEFKLIKHWAFPINTYVDYGLDKDPKEEYKVDPISPVIEFFGSLQKGEQAWLQMVIKPVGPTGDQGYDWAEEAEEVMQKILKPYTRITESFDGSIAREIRAPKYYDSLIDGMNRKTEKLGFEAGIRVMYVAKKEAFNMNNRRNIRLIFRQYSKSDSNELLRVNSAQADFYGGVFTSGPKTVMFLVDRMLHAYRERHFFHLPLRHHIFSKHLWSWPIPGVLEFSPLVKAYPHPNIFVLCVEEIATLWHFPGQILKVPTLERIESKEAAPPPNLPT